MASALGFRALVFRVSLLLFAAIVGLFLGGAFHYRPWGSHLAAAQGTAHVLYGGFWRTDGGFISTLRLEDVLVATPVEVTPTLYMADGTPYALPVVHIPAGGVATIDVNAALATAPPALAGHISNFGSASLEYTYPSGGHVYASSASVDLGRSLIYTNPFMEMPGMAGSGAKGQGTQAPQSSRQVFEGVWWKRDAGVSGFVTLSNGATKQVAVTLHLVDPQTASGGPGLGVNLAPHETRMISLDQIGGESQSNGAQTASIATAGGIRVDYQGMLGDVIVGGGLMNAQEGYSVGIPFWDHDATTATPAEISYASPGLMVGRPDPMMMPGFRPQTSFTPYLVLRNTTSEALGVFLGANYMTSSGASASVQLPEQFLAAFETRAVDLPKLLAGADLANFSGFLNIETQFTGNPGDLVLTTGSVDQTGSYVFAVAPQGVDKTTRKVGSYWSVAHGNDTMFSLWNPTGQAEDIAVSFRYGDGSGSYNLPVHLDALGSAMLDVGMLKMEGTPDSNGKPFSPSVSEGSVSFKNAKPGTWMHLVIAGGTFDAATGTCGGTCIQCCGWNYASFQISPTGIDAYSAVQATLLYSLYGEDCSTPDQPVPVDSWTSTDTSVATIDSSGNLTGVAPGSDTLQAYSTVYGGPIVQACSDIGNPICPAGSHTTTGPASILSVSQSPGQFNMSTGDTKQITVTVSPSSTSATTSFAGIGTTTSNPDSSCDASLSVPGGSGSGTISSDVTVPSSSANCSGVFSVTASANGVQSSDPTTVDVPPQVLIQVMYGEADCCGSQAQLGVGVTVRNRLGDRTYFGGVSDYQAAINSTQFNGFDGSLTTGVVPELGNAIEVWLTEVGNFITPSGAYASGCFWSPSATEWSEVSAAIQSGTADETQVPNRTGCYSGATYGQQIRVVSSVGSNGSGVPYFVFQGPRSSGTAPVAVEF